MASDRKNATIQGVNFKNLMTHGDERGFFREVIRVTDDFFKAGFGQLSHSLVQQGVLKAWHAHKYQHQWTYVACGVLNVAIYDGRLKSPTYRKIMEFAIGENQPVQIYSLPPGVAHGYRCVQGPVHVIYVTSGTYDPEDEVRIPHDDPKIGYDWIRQSQIK